MKRVSYLKKRKALAANNFLFPCSIDRPFLRLRYMAKLQITSSVKSKKQTMCGSPGGKDVYG